MLRHIGTVVDLLSPKCLSTAFKTLALKKCRRDWTITTRAWCSTTSVSPGSPGHSASSPLTGHSRTRCKPGRVTTKFQSELPSFKENLKQVSSVSLLMTSSTALANEGLFELTQCPSLTWAVSMSLTETTEEAGCSQMKMAKFCPILVIFRQI